VVALPSVIECLMAAAFPFRRRVTPPPRELLPHAGEAFPMPRRPGSGRSPPARGSRWLLARCPSRSTSGAPPAVRSPSRTHAPGLSRQS